MAKKSLNKVDRSDPKKNKSLAIRNVIKKKPTLKASEIVAAVKKEYGHTVDPNHVYMVKTKTNMASDGRPKKPTPSKNDTPMTSAALWVDAIKTARQLLESTGGLDNSIALLKAIAE